MGSRKFIKLYVIFSGLLFVMGMVPNHDQLLYDKKPALYTYISGDVKTSNIYAEHYSNGYVTPSSCLKVITALLAYKTLGNDFRYATNLYAIKKNDQTQDLIITFSGDPSLTTEDLLNLLKPVQNSKVKNIILDASAFNTPAHSKNLIIEDIGTYYSQPVSAMIVDENLIKVTANKNNLGYAMNSNLTYSAEPTNVDVTWKNNKVYLTGNLNNDDVNKEFSISPEHIDGYMIKKMQNIMRTLRITGDIVIYNTKTKLPANGVLVNTINSKPLSVILPPALKKSDNLTFDSLYLTIIHAIAPTNIKKWEDGDKIVKDLMQKYFAVNLDKALIVDGSGVSRYNRIQPSQLLEVLRKGYAVSEFVNALPYPGEVNSTLKGRGSILAAELRAKSGKMSGISCLCGYKISAEHPQAFVIVASSFAPPLRDIFPVIDEFVNESLVR